MGDENQPTKKRAAGRELSRDNPGLDEEEDVPEQELGTFQRASDEVLATRKIRKVRRPQPSAEPAASSNPFAGIRLVPPTAPPPATPTATVMTEAQSTEVKNTGDAIQIDETKSESEVTSQVSVEKPTDGGSEKKAEAEPTDEKQAEADEAVKDGKKDDEKQAEADEAVKDGKKDDEKQAEADEAVKDGGKDNEKQAETEAVKDEKKDDENPDANGGDAPLSSFQQLSSNQNAFTGLSGTGFSTSSFSFGSIPSDGSLPQSSSLPSFSFGASNNGSTPLFGTAGTSLGNKTEGAAFPSMQEVPRETGEENEDTVFNADSALFEFLDGGWKERGKGEVKVNVLKDETQKARLVMRAKGNLRLILNASLYPDMKLTKMDKKGITFACVNTATEVRDGLTTFALKFRDVSVVEEFSSIVSAHKGKPVSTTLKTPENSPKASDD